MTRMDGFDEDGWVSMGYVMVPVPEEHVEETMRLILRVSSQAKVMEWDGPSITDLFHQVDEPARSVMSAVARGTLASGPTSDVEVASSIEMSQREVLSITRDLNSRGAAEDRPALFILGKEVDTLPNGRTREMRTLTMDVDVAQWVREVERAELASAPHPLMSDRG